MRYMVRQIRLSVVGTIWAMYSTYIACSRNLRGYVQYEVNLIETKEACAADVLF